MSDKLSITALRCIVGAEDPEHECARCHQPMAVPVELEPSAVCNLCAQWFVGHVAPVLLEIAATGLGWAAAEDTVSRASAGTGRVLAAMRATEAFDKHRRALAKVRT